MISFLQIDCKGTAFCSICKVKRGKSAQFTPKRAHFEDFVQ